jgi:hypothetical protein
VSETTSLSELKAKLARYRKLVDYCETRLVIIGRMGAGEGQADVLRKTGENLKELKKKAAAVEAQLALVQTDGAPRPNPEAPAVVAGPTAT